VRSREECGEHVVGGWPWCAAETSVGRGRGWWVAMVRSRVECGVRAWSVGGCLTFDGQPTCGSRVL
jgi:hypothetical protein